MAEALFALVPPAFPAEVGRWVEQAAAESLASREALLAEIESGSSASLLPDPPAPVGSLAEDRVRGDPSSLAVETRSDGVDPARGRRARIVVVGVAGALAAVAALGIGMGRRSPRSPNPPVGLPLVAQGAAKRGCAPRGPRRLTGASEVVVGGLHRSWKDRAPCPPVDASWCSGEAWARSVPRRR
jgi:hypothetical protein